LRGAAEPRLRFDRVALGLVGRLQKSLADCAPDGRTLVVTITAPIRQDSKTAAALEERIRRLLAARRTRLRATIHGNRVQVRVLKGRARRGPSLIGFVHNPKPGASLLFELTRRLLKSGRRRVIAGLEEPAPSRTIEQVCAALRIRR
jgi:hypothetical protein